MKRMKKENMKIKNKMWKAERKKKMRERKIKGNR